MRECIDIIIKIKGHLTQTTNQRANCIIYYIDSTKVAEQQGTLYNHDLFQDVSTEKTIKVHLQIESCVLPKSFRLIHSSCCSLPIGFIPKMVTDSHYTSTAAPL